jgi:hypothetical protein
MHHAHTAKNFLSILKIWDRILQENLIHFYLKPNEILQKEKTYFLFQEFLGFNVTGEIFDFATDYQMAFSVICLN